MDIPFYFWTLSKVEEIIFFRYATSKSEEIVSRVDTSFFFGINLKSQCQELKNTASLKLSTNKRGITVSGFF